MALPSIVTPATDSYVNSGVEEKDPDAIKLFVGQVPKNFEEKDLKPYLAPYGTIHELSILRDKINMSHKGERRCRLVHHTFRCASSNSAFLKVVCLQVSNYPTLKKSVFYICRVCICYLLLKG